MEGAGTRWRFSWPLFWLWPCVCPRLSERPCTMTRASTRSNFAISGNTIPTIRSHRISRTISLLLYVRPRASDRAPHFRAIHRSAASPAPVLFGVGLILLILCWPMASARMLCAAAALLTAVSPAFVFYSRDYIHEMLLVFFTFLAIASRLALLAYAQPAWALLSGAAVGLMWATKRPS